MATQETTKVIRKELERACRDFSSQIVSLGFIRTKKMFWTRVHPLTVDFIHFHRSGSTYGVPINYSVDIRVHFGIRVLNDSFEAAALNGPYSDATLTRKGHYHLSFNAKSGSSYDRCITDLVRFVNEQGEPWFNRFQNIKKLLKEKDSPLNSEVKEYLKEANSGQGVPENETASHKILGIKAIK
jgi:hypothetical protein